MERLPTLVPQGEEDQLLGVPYLGRGTGDENEINQILELGRHCEGHVF